MDGKNEKVISPQDLAECFSDPVWAAKFPPVLTVDQAAALLQVPKQTIYDWSSRGRLKACARRAGKHLRIYRNKFLQLVFNEGINHDN